MTTFPDVKAVYVRRDPVSLNFKLSILFENWTEEIHEAIRGLGFAHSDQAQGFARILFPNAVIGSTG